MTTVDLGVTYCEEDQDNKPHLGDVYVAYYRSIEYVTEDDINKVESYQCEKTAIPTVLSLLINTRGLSKREPAFVNQAISLSVISLSRVSRQHASK